MSKFKVGDRVTVPNNNWYNSRAYTIRSISKNGNDVELKGVMYPGMRDRYLTFFIEELEYWDVYKHFYNSPLNQELR